MRLIKKRKISISRCENASASVILLILLYLIVVISGVVVIGAYCSYKEHTKKIEEKLDEMSKDIKALEGPLDIQKKNRRFVEYLREIIGDAAEPGNITFLFTVFSVALVSGGAYLLERSRQNVEQSNESAHIANETVKKAQEIVDKLKAKAEEAEKTAESSREKAEAAEDVFEKRETLRKISVSLSKGENFSRRLQKVKEKDRFNEAVRLRDSMSSAYGDFEYLVRRRDKLSGRQCHRFREHVVAIQANLEALPDEFQKQVEDIIERCNKTMALLRELC